MFLLGIASILHYFDRVLLLTVFFLMLIFISASFDSNELVSAKTSLHTYQNYFLKFSLQYPANWDIDTYDSSTCLKFDNCYIIFKTNSIMDGSTISIRVQNLNSIDLFACVCRTLSDYVEWNYKWNDNYKKTNLLNDNETIISTNHTAWQAELSKNQENSKSLIVFAIDDNLGYIFDYSVDNNTMYIGHMSDFRGMLRSINFVPTN